MKTHVLIFGLIVMCCSLFIVGCTEKISVPEGWDDKHFDVAETTNVSCARNSDCETPAEYLVMSSCPYTSACIDKKCAVVCPKQKPIVGGDKDEHGCIGSAGYSWCDEKQKCLRTWEENCTSRNIVGNDRDEHGCIPSAGYSWCEAKQKCLRTWEENCIESKACTEEAKICPDGSAVGRTGPDCEFAPCPNGTGIANPASTFCVAQGGESKIVTAADGSQSGICVLPYGIECDEWAYFRGECPEKHVCTEAEKAAEVCTLEYNPVCGDDGVTYGNKCAACASKKIDSYTPGECPAEIS